MVLVVEFCNMASSDWSVPTTASQGTPSRVIGGEAVSWRTPMCDRHAGYIQSSSTEVVHGAFIENVGELQYSLSD